MVTSKRTRCTIGASKKELRETLSNLRLFILPAPSKEAAKKEILILQEKRTSSCTSREKGLRFANQNTSNEGFGSLVFTVRRINLANATINFRKTDCAIFKDDIELKLKKQQRPTNIYQRIRP